MSMYFTDGSCILQCLICGFQRKDEWNRGDLPILVGTHCGKPMIQITHNDGKTSIFEVCPSYCCLPSRLHPIILHPEREAFQKTIQLSRQKFKRAKK
jgi:hypothetical protein